MTTVKFKCKGKDGKDCPLFIDYRPQIVTHALDFSIEPQADNESIYLECDQGHTNKYYMFEAEAEGAK